jgi:predicted CxxxxCH...CXXCH cytochrome family protein
MRKGDDIVKVCKGCFVVLTCFFALFLAAAKGYSHTIFAGVDGAGGAISPSGAVSVAAGDNQTFTITPELGYEILDVVTDAGSMGPVASYTFTDVTADDSITVSFSACVNPYPIMLESDGSYYNTIMEAYDVAYPSGSDTIMLRAGTFPEADLFFDQDASVAIRGGYDCSFVNDYMLTSIPGSLTVSAGTLIPSNIVISSPPPCAPGDPNNFPGNAEICDGLDNNCNGLIDDGLTLDNDHDGYTSIGSCGGNADDCDDGNSSINPGATEYYGDGIDQNCDGYDLYQTFDQNCFNCHWIGWVNDSFHHVSPPVDPNIAPCVDCHAAQVNNVMYGHYGRVVNTAGNNMDAGTVIYCTSCHDWHDSSEWNGFTNQARIVWPKVQAVGEGNETCDTCHENRALEHATNTAHNNRLIDSSCAQCHYPLSTQADIDTLHRSDCTLCHAYNGTKIWVQTVEQAIEDGKNGTPITCTNCHTTLHHSGTNPGVFYDPAVDTSQSSRQGCAGCHHDYDSVNGTSLGLSTWETILVEHDLDGTKDGSTNTCGTCHDYDGSGSPPLAAVQGAIANSSPDTCASCHTEKVPNVDHGIPTSGKHQEHFEIANMGCGTCHNTGNIPYFKSGTDSNGDGLYDLGETDVCYVCHQDGNGNPATGFKDGWGDPDFVMACDSCHALPPPIGSHLAHFSGTDDTLVYGDLRITADFSGGQVSSSYMIGCGNCHPMDPAYHGNGVWGDLELSNTAAPAGTLKALSPNGSYDKTTGACSNVYCHSVNSWTTDGPVPSPWPEATGWDQNVDGLPRPLPDNIITTRVFKDVTWNSGETLTCKGCHDGAPKTSDPDNDGGAGDSHYWVDSYGYENLHAYNMGFAPIGCRTCHYNTVQQASGWDIDPSTSRRYYLDIPIYDKAKHINGTIDVAFDTVNNYTYDSYYSGSTTYDLSVASFDSATKTCSNVGCHQQETQVKWGVPYRWYAPSEECNRCHGY